MKSCQVSSESVVQAIAGAIGRFPCARCGAEKKICQAHQDNCRGLYHKEAEAVYEQFVEPLNQNLRYRNITNWSLVVCILALLLILPVNVKRHHILERAVDTAIHGLIHFIPTLKEDFEIAQAKAEGRPIPKLVNLPDSCPLNIRK